MSTHSNIEWTDSTWSPVTGCTKVSLGCKHCYAEREVKTRWSKNPRSVFYGRPFTDVRCHPEALYQPLRWRKSRRVFVCPRADLFHDAVPVEFIDKVFAVMSLAFPHTFQLLTKRPDRMRAYISGVRDRAQSSRVPLLVHVRDHEQCLGVLRSDYEGAKPWPLQNAWIGVSCEDQATADERIPLLMRTPAAVRFISAEPLLGPIDLTSYLQIGTRGADGFVTSDINWVIAGGESGPGARPMHPDWARSIRDQCQAAGVSFFFKQWGEWAPHGPGACIARVGKRSAGRLLDGREWSEYPT